MGQIRPYSPLDRVSIHGQRAGEISEFMKGVFESLPGREHYDARSGAGHQILLLLDGDSLTECARMAELAQVVILNLEDVRLARLSHELTRPVCWFTSQDARRQLGALIDVYRGAYWDAIHETWLHQTDDDFGRISIPGVNPPQDLRFLVSATIAALRSLDIPLPAIEKAIELHLDASGYPGDPAAVRARPGRNRTQTTNSN